jgi:hypothetical protein
MNAAPDASDATLAEVAGAVTAMATRVFGSLEAIASALSSQWDRLVDNGIAPSAADLHPLREVVFAELSRHSRLLNGAGVVLAVNRLADRPRHLEWWRTEQGRREAQKLNLDLNPHSEYFYDYSTMAWFAEPRDDGTRCIHGPYLDFTCADLNVCTFAVPVRSRNGGFLGIAGADAPVARIDAELLPRFQTSRRLLALVNAEGRIIVANHADHVAGSKLKASDRAGRPQPVPETPWQLVTLD